VSSATLAFLGLSAADYTAPEPAEWTPEALDVALRRLRALAGAQIRLHGADGMRGGGKNVVLCGPVGPTIGPRIPACFAEAIRRALLASLRAERGDWFSKALRDAASGDLSARDRLAAPWPATNSGVELAQGNAALFLLGAPLRHRDTFLWHRHPGQPGARLRRLVALAAARPW
jgi:hypothetical protein